MFLIERISGIGIYLSTLSFICIIMTRTNVRCKSILKFYLLCLCIMARFYEPYITADLYRIFDMIDMFSSVDFANFWETYIADASSPISRILYWCFGRMGLKEWLPAFSALVTYSIIFYVIDDTRQKYNISKRNVAIELLFVMTTSIYLSTIGGIRMMLALSVIIYCFYRESVNHRRYMIDIILYIFAFFMHNMASVVILIRLVVSIFDTTKKRSYRIKVIFFAMIAGSVLMAKFRSLLFDIIDKAYGYIFGDEHYDVWEYMMGFLILVFMIITIRNYLKYVSDEEYRELRQFNTAVKICIFISVLFCFEFSIFYRFVGHIVPLISIPMTMITLQEAGKKQCIGFKVFDYRSVTLLFTILIMVISFTRGSMSSLKFFVL